jgi:hypothetical protein
MSKRTLVLPILFVALAAVATVARAHSSHDAKKAGPDDGHITMRYSGTGGDRTWNLHTLDDHQEVRLQLVASTGKTRIDVRIVDPDGRRVAHMHGQGELDVDSGTLRLVDGEAGAGEGRRGTWRVEVTTTPGEGEYTLRWWGLAPPSGQGDGD